VGFLYFIIVAFVVIVVDFVVIKSSSVSLLFCSAPEANVSV
jgi:hypothetical protein